jgi:hypothetical protein
MFLWLFVEFSIDDATSNVQKFRNIKRKGFLVFEIVADFGV